MNLTLKEQTSRGNICFNRLWHDVYIMVTRIKKKSSKKFIYTLATFIIKKDQVFSGD